jgi:Ser/Thr protein kinase RdoA (MazF antagonist)
MSLSTMWDLHATIDSAGSSPVATALAAPWEPDAPPTHFRSSANFVFTFPRGGKRIFLRFAPAAHRSPDAVTAELAAMARARATGIPTPEPLRNLDGDELSLASAGGTTFVVVALSALSGAELTVEKADVERCAAWGGLVARLQHALAGSSTAGGRTAWSDEVVRLERILGSTAPPMVRHEFTDLVAALSTWGHADGDGLVHLDVELDNLRWIAATPGVLDFDDCSHHWYAVDVASALRDLDDEPDRRETFLAAYEATGGASVRHRLTVARRWLDLKTYATIARSLDLAPADGHPDWLHQLHRRLTDRQRAYVDSLGRR